MRIGIQVPGQQSATGSPARFVPKFKFAPSFAKRPEASETKPNVKPAEIVVTLKPHDGELRCEPQGMLSRRKSFFIALTRNAFTLTSIATRRSRPSVDGTPDQTHLM